MTITNIRVDSITPKVRGICGEFTITLDDLICIHHIYVINGSKGLFIAFPNTGEAKQFKNTKRYADIVHPTNADFRKYIENTILEKYNKMLNV